MGVFALKLAKVSLIGLAAVVFLGTVPILASVAKGSSWEEVAGAIAIDSTSSPRAAQREVAATCDRLVYFAGWADKFEQVLPRVMRAHGIDMWIVAVKENHREPLWEDLGRGYVSGIGYYVFTDRGGERIERAALGPSGYLIEESGAYDLFAPASQLAEFVKARDPKRIGVNISEELGSADGLSYSLHGHLVKTLGEPYASRLVSAEHLVSEFRSRRVASEIVAFGESAGR